MAADYFQCFFMRAEQTPLPNEGERSGQRIFQKPDEIYLPHLSLAYGSYPESRKRAIIHELPPDVQTSFEVTAFSLIKAESDDPKDWHEISTCPFTG